MVSPRIGDTSHDDSATVSKGHRGSSARNSPAGGTLPIFARLSHIAHDRCSPRNQRDQSIALSRIEVTCRLRLHSDLQRAGPRRHEKQRSVGERPGAYSDVMGRLASRLARSEAANVAVMCWLSR